MQVIKRTMQRTAVYNLIVLLVGPVVGTPALAGGDTERGRSKAQQCVACHGEKGQTSNPQFPNLAGQNAAYLEMQLKNFKSGKRTHPVMTPIAKTLSDEDIADLSLYYSKLACPAGKQ